MNAFGNFDFSDFWNDAEWTKTYTGTALTADKINNAEVCLDYVLPMAYIELMQIRNGGVPQKNYFLPPDKNRCAVYLNTVWGLDPDLKYSLCGENGNKRCVEQWGYPVHGVYFGDTLSGGHEMFLMDYRKCGKNGAPEIVLVDQECDYRITFVAENFEAFVKGLMFEEDVPEDRL